MREKWYIASAKIDADGKAVDTYYWEQDPQETRKAAMNLLNKVLIHRGAHSRSDITPPKGFEYVYEIDGIIYAAILKCAPYNEELCLWCR